MPAEDIILMKKLIVAMLFVSWSLSYGVPLDLTGMLAPGQCKANIDPKPCVEVANEGPLGAAAGWHLTYNINVDWQKKKGRIIAYKILWSTQNWSEWYVPGITDLDWKYSTVGGQKQVRRLWSYFTDHVHTYIICY